MHDPFPLQRPEILVPYVQKVADYLHLQTLPLHFHEVVLSFGVYHAIHKYGAPAISRFLLPRTYSSFSARTKLNWDVHIVSFFQSTLICALALWVNYADKERYEMTTEERVYGYTGASGLVQAFAGGYFLWDLIITLQNVSAFGIGMLFHAISALCVFSLGFRPFVNYYATSFILYELSSPFLNIHWFCDKLNMTGSTIQFVNGICLLVTFFSCRLVWGTYNSIRVAWDVYNAYTAGTFPHSDPETGKLNANTTVGNAGFKHNILQFADGQYVPLWLAGAYLASNITLNSLNWYWFGKMIETLRKRFDPPFGTRRPEVKEPEHIPENEKVFIEGMNVATPMATPAALDANGTDYMTASDPSVVLEKSKSGTHLEVSSSEVRSRTSTRRKA